MYTLDSLHFDALLTTSLAYGQEADERRQFAPRFQSECYFWIQLNLHRLLYSSCSTIRCIMRIFSQAIIECTVAFVFCVKTMRPRAPYHPRYIIFRQWALQMLIASFIRSTFVSYGTFIIHVFRWESTFATAILSIFFPFIRVPK